MRGATKSMVVVCAALMGVSASARAQQTGRRTTTGSRSNATTSSAPPNAENPGGTFHQNGPLQTTNIGSGSGPTQAAGPVGELRGNTAPAPDVIAGPIGPGDVARIMQAQMPRLQPCYTRALSTHPQLEGRVEVRFTLGRDGHVTQSAAYGLNDAPEVATCIADTIRATPFPQPQGGSLQFIYPIMFRRPAPRPSQPGARPARRRATHS
jgi:hypothetical protein